MSDSGGAAHDIYQYVLGPPGGWDADARDRPLPEADPFDPVRNDAYVKKATQLLPKILELGQKTGQNTTRQLAFFTMSNEVDIREDLCVAIQKSMMNDCPNVNEEALLAVVWGEPDFLEIKLEENAESILLLGKGSEVKPAVNRSSVMPRGTVPPCAAELFATAG